MINFEAFANTHRLKTRRDSCGEPLVIVGRPPRPRPEDCCHIYHHDETRLGLVLLYDRALLWNNAKKRLLAAGFELAQNGDTEGVLLFDPENAVHVRLALKAAGIHPRQQMSEKGRAALQVNIKKALAARAVQRQQEAENGAATD